MRSLKSFKSNSLPANLPVQPKTFYIFSRIYWSELGYQPAIKTALMDGTRRGFLVLSKLKWPISLALDSPASRLYWCDSKLKSVESISINQTDRLSVRKFTGGDTPVNVALHENNLYIITQSGTLYLLNKFGKGQLTVLARGLKRPVGLVVYQQQHQSKQKGEDHRQYRSLVRTTTRALKGVFCKAYMADFFSFLLDESLMVHQFNYKDYFSILFFLPRILAL